MDRKSEDRPEPSRPAQPRPDADRAANTPDAGGESALPAEELIPEGEEEEPSGEPSEIEILRGETVLLEEQLQQMRDRYIRAVADLDNARKRARQAISDARHQAVAGVLLDLLSLVDNFERALESARPGADAPADTKAVYEGVELIYRQLMGMLDRRGVRPIEALGQLFDPNLHEAVAEVPAGKQNPEGAVVYEMQRGYLYGDQVLRHSRVGVAVRRSSQEEPG